MVYADPTIRFDKKAVDERPALLYSELGFIW